MSVRTTELPVSVLDFCLQSMGLLPGCSRARAGSKGAHGADWGKDLPQQPCPSVRSRAEPGVVMGHTRNHSHISVHTGVQPNISQNHFGSSHK